MNIDEERKLRLAELKAFFVDHYDELSYYAWHKMNSLSGEFLSKNDIKEVMNDTYITAYNSIRLKNRKILNYHGWVRKLIYFSLLTRIKRNRRFKSVHQTMEDIEYSDKLQEFLMYSIENETERKDEVERIKNILSDEDWKVVDLHLSGYKSEEIAKKLDKSSEAVRQQYSRALRKIRKKYKL